MNVDVIGLRGFPGIQGGVERHCESLYPRMRCNFRVFRRKSYLNEASSASYPNIEYADLGSTRIAGFETVWHTFRSVLRSILRRPDLVHVHNIGPGLFIPLLKLFGLKVVLTYHSPNYEHAKWGRFARAVLRTGENFSLRWADRIIFVNNAQMKKFSSKVQKKSVRIANGFEPQTPSDKRDFVDSLGLKDVPYLLAVGRLTPEKGFEYLVEAVNKCEAVPALVIAGGSDHGDAYLNKLKALDKKNKVHFAGNLNGEPLRQLYSHAAMFALSSVNEGFPLVVLEAMNYRLPLVASRIPATDIPQIADTRKFSPGDPADMVRILNTTFGKGDARIDYDLSAYDWDRIARLTEDVYRLAVAPKNR